MSLTNLMSGYGEKVPGYDVPVINEREARAAAGILFMLGMIVIFVAIGYNHVIVARVYLAFLWVDFTARIISPKYAPSLLMGKFVVNNQTPEYVGAAQKRFAWALGWLISLPMVYWFVLHWDITFYKVMICVLCLTLMFFETAFGICLGCMLYKFISKEDPSHCPGGVCEVKTREDIQKFNPIQATIAIVVFSGFMIGIYLFLAKTESKTFFGEFIYEALLTKEQLQAEEDLKYQQELDKMFNDDDF